jgi:hypothetical protein
LDAARKITNPKVRDEVERRLQARFSDQRRIDRERENDVFVAAANYIDSHPGRSARDAVPAHVWTTLKPTQRRSLELYAKRAAGDDDDDAPGSDKAWLDFVELDIDEVGDLTRSEFETRYLSKMGKKERGRAITRWKDAKDKGKSGDKENVTINFNERVKGTLARNRLVPDGVTPSQMTEEQRATYREVEFGADAGIREFRRIKKRDPDQTETQSIIDAVIFDRVFDTTKKDTKRINIREGGRVVGQVVRQRDGSVTTDFDEIPSDVLNEFRRLAQERGVKFTRKMAERAYAERITRGIAYGREAIR